MSINQTLYIDYATARRIEASLRDSNGDPSDIAGSTNVLEIRQRGQFVDVPIHTVAGTTNFTTATLYLDLFNDDTRLDPNKQWSYRWVLKLDADEDRVIMQGKLEIRGGTSYDGR